MRVGLSVLASAPPGELVVKHAACDMHPRLLKDQWIKYKVNELARSCAFCMESARQVTSPSSAKRRSTA